MPKPQDAFAAPQPAGGRDTAPRSATPRRSAEIIDAAARVFARRGYHGTTTTDIADELGIRQASLYYYFASKEAALEAVCDRGAAAFVDVAEAIVGAALPPAQMLEQLINAHLRPIGDYLDYVRVFINERRYLPASSRRRVGRRSRRVEKLLQTVIESGIADDSFRKDIDARLATLAILGMCNSVQSWFEKEEFELGSVQREFVALALQGLQRRDSGSNSRQRRKPRRRET